MCLHITLYKIGSNVSETRYSYTRALREHIIKSTRACQVFCLQSSKRKAFVISVKIISEREFKKLLEGEKSNDNLLSV